MRGGDDGCVNEMTKTVLIVDDDPTQRRLVQAVLEREGFGKLAERPGILCLGRTDAGLPRHPLYVRGDTPLELFER